MKRLKKYSQFLILEKFDDNFKAELIRLGITDKEEIAQHLHHAHRGHSGDYLKSKGNKMSFGMLSALFKDAQAILRAKFHKSTNFF